VSPRRFTGPAVGSGGCRQADLRGVRLHGGDVRGGAWEGADSRGVRDRVLRCRLAFWSGIGRRPGRSSRGTDTSGADT
jgi:hypothetical protein